MWIAIVVLWLLPGSALVVNWFLGEPLRRISAGDRTVSNEATTNYGLQGVNMHGDPPGGGYG